MGENMAGKCSSWYGDAMPTDRLVFQSYNLHPNTYCLETMLFDTEADPWELQDVAADEPDKLQALTKLLNDHLEHNGEHV